MLQFVQQNVHEDAKIVTKQAKTIHINLPRDVKVQDIFMALYSDAAAEGEPNVTALPFVSAECITYRILFRLSILL